MKSLRDMPNTMFAVHPPGHERAGQTIERRKVCECGAAFTQMQMAMRELEALERMGQIARFLKQVPEAFVPVHCPKCERHQLTLHARLAESGTYANTLPDRRSA